MGRLEEQFAAHLHRTLGLKCRQRPWADAEALPTFLGDRYRFATARLMEREVLLVLDEAPDPAPPSVIRKHLAGLREKWPGDVVYVRADTTSFHRARLIEQGVSFVVPGNQVYLPTFGLDLRERFRSARGTPIRRFRPSTQAVLIHALLRDEGTSFVAKELAPLLGYSPMTLSRAFDELESAELARSEQHARERRLHLTAERSEVWRRARPLLVDPVRSRHSLTRLPRNLTGLLSGETALGRLTMLAAPGPPVHAMGTGQWNELTARHGDLELPALDPDAPLVEVWKYPPREHRVKGVVEPLSLLLSFPPIEIDDERLAQSLEHLGEHLPW